MNIRCMWFILACALAACGNCGDTSGTPNNGSENNDPENNPPNNEPLNNPVTEDEPFAIAPDVGGRALLYPMKREPVAAEVNRAIVIDFDDGTLLYETPDSSGDVDEAVLSEDGSTLFYEGADQSFVVDVDSGDETVVAGPENDDAIPLGISPDGSRLVLECFTTPSMGTYTGAPNNICVRENGSTETLLAPANYSLGRTGVRPLVSPDANVAYIHEQETLFVVDLESGSIDEADFAPRDYGGIATMSDDGSIVGFIRVLSQEEAGEDGVYEFTAYDMNTDEPHVFRYDPFQSVVAPSPSLSPDGSRVATNDGDVRLWYPTDNPEDTRELGPVPDLGFGSWGPRLYWNYDGTAVVYSHPIDDDEFVEHVVFMQEIDAAEPRVILETSYSGDEVFTSVQWVTGP